jgi:uncharacterized protein
MPIAPTYPGVYIEEIPSGVRTIVGVATSITAFVGRAPRGPVDEPVVINNYGDFERNFGGLSADYPVSYAVRDFFLNGGSKAIMVRVFKAPAEGATTATLTLDNLKLQAADSGKWGENLRASVDYNGITADVAKRYAPLKADDLFNLTVVEVDPNDQTRPVRKESLRNLSMKDGPRRVDRVLENESDLMRIATKNDGTPDLPTGADAKRPELTDAQNVPKPNAVVDSAGLDSDAYTGDRANKKGLYALEKADLFNLLCLPPDQRGSSIPNDALGGAMKYCVERRAMLIVDPPDTWKTSANAVSNLSGLSLSGLEARNAALYFPRVIQADPNREGQPDTFVACGAIAGIMARTDAQRGVWKAPAGQDASINGIQGLATNLTDAENGDLNQLGVNCLRSFPITGRVVWGARTLRGADQLADEYKYVPVRRLALYIEESLFRGTQWVVFEPNDEPLWAQIRLNVGAFMHNLFRQGAFQGRTPREAYFVKCDKETTTQNDMNLGIVNIVVGFAPLKPAEFVFIRLQQITGQIEV